MSKPIDILGTPKTLEEAIFHILVSGPVSKIQEKGPAVIRDFLAQKFNVAMFQNPDKADMLKALFEEIVREAGALPYDEPYHDLSDPPEHYPTEK